MSAAKAQLEAWVRQACLIEVRSHKPGNVSPDHSFDNATLKDFEKSARTVAPILSAAPRTAVGETILKAITATQAAVGHNTNLGIVLLIAPLASVPSQSSLQDGIANVLNGLTIDDSIAVYEAIRIAAPGGLGDAQSQDVHDIPTVDLKQCMALAADHDLIAAQYGNGFSTVLEHGLTLLQKTEAWHKHHRHRIAWVAISLMAQFGDSLIRRKSGVNVEVSVQEQAQAVLKAGWPFDESADDAFARLDQFLKADGNRRNPGTTADMIAAIVFSALREGLCVADDTESQLIFPEVVS